MPAFKAKNIKLMLESKGEDWTREHLSEALESGQLKPEDFSLRDLFEQVVPDGGELIRSFSPMKSGGFVPMAEASGAVQSSHFANITGQILYTSIMSASMTEAFVFTPLIPVVPTVFSGEKVPGIANPSDDNLVVAEGEEFPLVGLMEDWLQTPDTKKRGSRIALTKEAIFFDRTGMILSQARAIGTTLGSNKEKRAIDAVIDENTTAHRHNYRGNTIATFGDSSGTHDFDNLAATNTLTDWSSIDAVEQLAAAVTDRNTGEPMPMMLDSLIVTPQNRATAYRIMSATNIALQAGGFATSGNLYRTDSPSPIGRHEYSAAYRVLSSRLLAQRMTTDTTWYLGNIAEAVEYRQNWPLAVRQLANGDEDFKRDIPVQYRVDERGAFFVKEPRYLFKATVA